MTKIDLEIHDDIISAINKIKNINDEGIELVIPEGSVLLENILNLKLLNKEAEKLEKILHFQTSDEAGQNLLSMLNEDEGLIPFDNFSPSETLEKKGVNKQPAKIPSFPLVLSVFNRLPSIKGRKKPLLFIAVLVILLLIVGRTISKLPKAKIGVILNSQALARSLQIRIGSTTDTNVGLKILKGLVIQDVLSDQASVATTGQKLVGKQATGKVKISNLTDTDTDFKKSAVLIYTDKNDKKFNYTLNDNVTVPAETVDLGPPIVQTPGEVEVDITAGDIGSSYNLDKDVNLSVKGYKGSQFTASISTTISGGSSENKKIVAEADRVALSTSLQKILTDKTTASIQTKLGTDQKLIQGSVQIKVTGAVYDFNVGDTTDTLKLTQTVTASGLTYLTNDLNKLLDQLVQNLIPEGFVISDKEREVGVEVLGNADATVLGSDKADVQVTLKTFVIPKIDEKDLKSQLKGRSLPEAQKILGSIRNLKTYSLDLSPNIPFLSRIPTDFDRININVTHE